MAGERGSAVVARAGTAVLIMLSMSMLFHSHVVEAATNYNVTWEYPKSKTAYVNWAKGKTFNAGDQLVFQVQAGHNVIPVNATTYTKCSTSGNPSKQNSPIPLPLKRGTNYFICSVPTHCSKGMKLQVTAK